ncbi:hypothetical protein [Desulfobacter sp.]|uniref:hypothetical protein n=1 Tax=Desulfobacter sp. TaxID=2294 RepID=UPI003D0CD8AE
MDITILIGGAAGLRVLGAGLEAVHSTIKDHFSGLKKDLLEKTWMPLKKGLKKSRMFHRLDTCRHFVCQGEKKVYLPD